MKTARTVSRMYVDKLVSSDIYPVDHLTNPYLLIKLFYCTGISLFIDKPSLPT